MNVHEKPRPVKGSPGRLRYTPVSPRENPPRNGALERIAAIATAPLIGSRLFFPRRFNGSFEASKSDPEAPGVIPEHAMRFFGDTLHLDIDPSRLRRRITDWVRCQQGVRWVGVSFLDAADWSEAILPVERSPIHREMLELVTAGNDFRDTRSYRNLLHAIELGRPSKRNNVRLASVETVEAYFRYIHDLIASLKEHGVVRHSRTGAFHRLRLKHREARSPMHDSTERDIGVAISETGELIRHLGGKHRTAIAQALGLAAVPVEIRMVHTAWLARQVEMTGLPPHRALVKGIGILLHDRAFD